MASYRNFPPTPDAERNPTEIAGPESCPPPPPRDRIEPNSKMYVIRFLARGSFRYAKRCAKNCARMLLGRKPYFAPKDRFFLQYLRHILGIRPITKITCLPSKFEGAGSQALYTMVTISFARACGFTYVHTPFVEIAHADRPMQDWVAAWEEHFNLEAGELTTNDDLNQIVNFPDGGADLCALFGVEDLTRVLEVMRADFRHKYYLNKSSRHNQLLTVAVHVRRGDVTPMHPPMWTNTAFVAETVAMVRTVLAARDLRYKICLFSQGDRADFAELDAPDTEMFLDHDAIWTMREAIEADVLIMARSMFSYVAALLSDGIKICEDGLVPPFGGKGLGTMKMRDWVV